MTMANVVTLHLQALEFLDKALYGDDEDVEMDPHKAGVIRSDSATSQSPPGSPFVKKVENILQV